VKTGSKNEKNNTETNLITYPENYRSLNRFSTIQVEQTNPL